VNDPGYPKPNPASLTRTMASALAIDGPREAVLGE